MSRSKRAAVYARISDDKAGEGHGVERQQRDGKNLAKRLGATVIDTFVDNDVSAYSGAPRPAYQRMLELVRSGAVNTVIAWHNDRLHRNPKELETFIDLIEETRAEVHFVTSGQFDLSTPTGRMVARQVGVLARYESEHRAERISRAHRHSAERGRYRGGTTRIFGYQPDGYTLNVNEASAIRRAYDSVLNGESLASILRDWDKKGIRTSNGNRFSHITLRNILLRERNFGASTYKGETVGIGDWAPIVDEALFLKVQTILQNPARVRNQSNRAKYLLSGVLKCGKCADLQDSGVMGAHLAKRRNGDSVRYYRCKTCHSNFIKIADTDEFITTVVLSRLNREDARIPADESSESNDLISAAQSFRIRLEELVDMFTAGEITRAQHARASERLKKQLSETEAKIASDGDNSTLTRILSERDVEAAWASRSIGQRKMIIRALADITLLPTGRGYVRKFQPSRLKIEWK